MIVYSGSVPLGALWTGRVAQSWGVAFVMGLSAVLCVAVALIVWASGVLAPVRLFPLPRDSEPSPNSQPHATDATGRPLEVVERRPP
jgi:hypothetical protein